MSAFNFRTSLNRKVQAVIVTMVAAVLCFWVFRPPASLGDRLDALVASAFSAEAGVILKSTPESDLKLMNVSKEEWKRFVEMELVPRISQTGSFRTKRVLQVNGNTLAAHYGEYTLNGRKYESVINGDETGQPQLVVSPESWLFLFSKLYCGGDLGLKDEEIKANWSKCSILVRESLNKYGIRSYVDQKGQLRPL